MADIGTLRGHPHGRPGRLRRRRPAVYRDGVRHGRALGHVMAGFVRESTGLCKEHSDNDSLRRWLQETVSSLTVRPERYEE